MQEPPPLILCLEKGNGEEVNVQISPGDDFHCFLRKAKAILGYDIDITSVTRNQPVALTDDIYQFLIKNEKGLAAEVFNAIAPSVNNNNEDYYVLEDGTQIRASQIHFDNEDTPVDLLAEKIPFVKINDAIINDFENQDTAYETKFYNIVSSPVRYSKDNGSFFIPFKLIPNHNKKLSGFEAQFLKYIDKTYTKSNAVMNRNNSTYGNLNAITNLNKSHSLIRENIKKHDVIYQRNNTDLNNYSREDIINLYKDCAASSYEKSRFLEKRRHVRKSNPSRLFHKNLDRPIPYIDANRVLVPDIELQKCVVCSKFVQNGIDKVHIFDNENQRFHGTKLRITEMHSKIICAKCLAINFKLGRVKGPKKYLKTNEYLVIRNGKQYIFDKVNPEIFKRENNDEVNSEVELESKENISNMNDKSECVKFELGTDGEIETKTLNEKEDLIVKDEKKESSSDVEIIEKKPEFGDVENLEDIDEDVIEFLGKYQCDRDIKELKCRFCEKLFNGINEVIDHGTEHKHDMEDGVVFPCPLCDYGYDDIKWLKGHLKAAHDESRIIKGEAEQQENVKRETGAEDFLQTNVGESNMMIKTEVKQEAIENSDDDVWIVQTADDEADRQMNILFNAPKKYGTGKLSCDVCSQIFRSIEAHSTHKCLRRGRKRRSRDEEIVVPCNEEFLRRAQGKMRTNDDSGDIDIVRPRKKKNKGHSSDPQIVICHNCNESFTSKVRLKFHMQFHDTTNMLTPEGEYKCAKCDGTTFQSETALFDHVHFQHNKQCRWRCHVSGCEKTFYLRAALTKHSRMHTDTRRYVCGTCGKRFLDKQTLDEHGVTHLQIKPFQCHICLKQLTRRSRLRMHLRAHEEELVPTLVLGCAACGRAFRGAADVQGHLRSFPECLEEFTKELKQEEAVTVQLSPTTGIVRHSMQVVESPRLSILLPYQATGPKAEALLNLVPEAARPIIRCLLIEKAFRCEYCEDVFFSELGLNTHRAIHKGLKNPFVCHICKVSFATYSRCTTHKTTHGFYKRPLADVKKQQDKSTRDTKPCFTGILGYGDFPVVKHFLCEECGRSYLHWTYLQVHRRMKHAADNGIHKCDHCDMVFPNSWSLAYHRKKMHTKTDQVGVTKHKDEILYHIPCRDCDETFTNKTALYKHRKKEHCVTTLQGNSCNYNSVPKLFPYTTGGAISDTKYAEIQTGKEDDTTVVQFVCEVCKQGFPTRTELTVHANAHAPNAVTAQGIRVHMCGWCSRAFRTQSALAEHVRAHTGERPFACDVCGAAFRRITAMRNHRLIHSGIRAFACAQCPKRFRLKADLKTHYRVKHPAELVVLEGMSGFIPTTTVALQTLSNNPHTQGAGYDPNQKTWLGRGIAKSKPNIYTTNNPSVPNLHSVFNHPNVSLASVSNLPKMSTFPYTPNTAHASNISDASHNNNSKMTSASNMSNVYSVPSNYSMFGVSTKPKMSTVTNISNISNRPRMSSYMSNFANIPKVTRLSNMSKSNMPRMATVPRMSNFTNMTRMSTFNMSSLCNMPRMVAFPNVSNIPAKLSNPYNPPTIPYKLRLPSNTYNVITSKSHMPYVSCVSDMSKESGINCVRNISNLHTKEVDVSFETNMTPTANISNTPCMSNTTNVSSMTSISNTTSVNTDLEVNVVNMSSLPVSCTDMPKLSYADTRNVSYTDMQNVSYTDMRNVSCTADMQNVSCTDTQNVSYTDMQNVSCTPDMPNVSYSDDMQNVSHTDTQNVSFTDTQNVPYTDMQNVSCIPCIADMPNVSYSDDMQNVSHTDAQNVSYTDTQSVSYTDMQNVSYIDMQNVSYTDMQNVSYADMQNVSCTDTQNVSYTDMQNVSCTDDVANLSYTDMQNASYPDMQNVSCTADMANVSYTDMHNVSCTGDMQNASCTDTQNISYTDMQNVSYADMHNVSCTGDMQNASCTDTQNISYTDMQNVSYADMHNVSCTGDMQNVSYTDTQNISHTDMQNISYAAESNTDDMPSVS